MTSVRDRIVELRRVPAADLRANPKNWRRHPAAQQNALRGVLADVGYADALLARQTPEGLVLIDGHLRAETTPDAVVPVLILDVTEEEADKILLTHDPLAAMAEADKDALASLIANLEFSDPAIDAMLEQLARESRLPMPSKEGNTDPDAVPDLPAIATSKLGDLYMLGEHRLLCGDSTDPATVARLLDGAKPMMMVTDPPYGVEYNPAWRVEAGVNQNTEKLGKVTNDDRADWREAWKLFPGIIAYVWHASLQSVPAFESLTSQGFNIRAQIIWAKDRFALSRGDYHWQHEPCWYAIREGGRASTNGDRSQSTLWTIPAREDDGHGHGTQKPVECMERPIRNHDAAEIYEPFCGSGTTIIAAERQRRRCYAIELEPLYVDVAIQRWQEYTGQKAVLLDGR